MLSSIASYFYSEDLQAENIASPQQPPSEDKDVEITTPLGDGLLMKDQKDWILIAEEPTKEPCLQMEETDGGIINLSHRPSYADIARRGMEDCEQSSLSTITSCPGGGANSCVIPDSQVKEINFPCSVENIVEDQSSVIVDCTEKVPCVVNRIKQLNSVSPVQENISTKQKCNEYQKVVKSRTKSKRHCSNKQYLPESSGSDVPADSQACKRTRLSKKSKKSGIVEMDIEKAVLPNNSRHTQVVKVESCSNTRNVDNFVAYVDVKPSVYDVSMFLRRDWRSELSLSELLALNDVESLSSQNMDQLSRIDTEKKNVFSPLRYKSDLVSADTMNSVYSDASDSSIDPETSLYKWLQEREEDDGSNIKDLLLMRCSSSLSSFRFVDAFSMGSNLMKKLKNGIYQHLVMSNSDGEENTDSEMDSDDDMQSTIDSPDCDIDSESAINQCVIKGAKVVPFSKKRLQASMCESRNAALSKAKLKRFNKIAVREATYRRGNLIAKRFSGFNNDRRSKQRPQ